MVKPGAWESSCGFYELCGFSCGQMSLKLRAKFVLRKTSLQRQYRQHSFIVDSTAFQAFCSPTVSVLHGMLSFTSDKA